MKTQNSAWTPPDRARTRRLRAGWILWTCLWALPGLAQATTEWVGQFHSHPSAWQEIRLNQDITPNRFERRLWDGVQALEVHSAASMSLMARPLNINLQATPVLCWRWRVDAVIAQANMNQRQGDDYAARVYVSFQLPESAMSFGLRTKLRLARSIWGSELPDAALNYVWDNQHPVDTQQPNVYTDRAMMVVQRRGNQDAGRWVEERRDILKDVTRHFSAQARAVQLAVTADSDNTRQSAHAGFADFHFVAAEQACQFPPVQP